MNNNDKYVTNANKGKLFCCFVDFQKAFDSIWQDGLLHKLLYKNLGGQFYHLISDMYSKTKCAVKTVTKEVPSSATTEECDKDVPSLLYSSICI